MHVVIFGVKTIIFTFNICGGKDNICFKKQGGIFQVQRKRTFGASRLICIYFKGNTAKS